MTIIDPGQLDRPVTLRRKTLIPGPLNDIEVWSAVFDFWAMLKRVSEDELWAEHEQYARRVVTFTSHWFADIREIDTLVCEGIVYEIKGIGEIGLKHGLEIKAEVINPQPDPDDLYGEAT